MIWPLPSPPTYCLPFFPSPTALAHTALLAGWPSGASILSLRPLHLLCPAGCDLSRVLGWLAPAYHPAFCTNATSLERPSETFLDVPSSTSLPCFIFMAPNHPSSCGMLSLCLQLQCNLCEAKTPMSFSALSLHADECLEDSRHTVHRFK